MTDFLSAYRVPLAATAAGCVLLMLLQQVAAALSDVAAFLCVAYILAAAALAYRYGKSRTAAAADPQDALVADLRQQLADEQAVTAAMRDQLHPGQFSS